MRGKAEHLDKLHERLDESDQPGSASAASREALAQRLARLPPAHPSSVRMDGPDRPPEGRTRENGPPPRPDGPDSPPGFWDKVERFHSLWQAHLKSWPDKPRLADRVRADDPPGSWRGDGNRYLGVDDNAEADEALALLHEPEEAITAQLLQIQQDNPYGGYLAGLDHRLKGDDRMKEKIVDEIAGEAGASIADVAGRISDAIRYTLCFGMTDYVRGYADTLRRLESAGYELTYSKNRWLDGPQYKGVNTHWQAPGGARFELQFHIPESFYAKQHLTHGSYDRLRSLETSRSERRSLNAYERAVVAALPVPPRVAEIRDVNAREPR